ncbi:MAG: type II toxin-antitoxin system VapC family toxin [Candidatus Thermoplasmatota archaeon]|nr:type II toxin-antitoxin system VapC family toxin [Candidatus Thermoplasmatota archaeon]
MRYFDTSFLAPLILEEATSEKVEAFMAKLPAGELCISHWTRTEFASLLAREVRMGGLTEANALAAVDQFDAMVGESFQPKAFAKKEPVSQEAWLCELTGERVRFRPARGRGIHDFPLALFQISGTLPWPT